MGGGLDTSTPSAVSCSIRAGSSPSTSVSTSALWPPIQVTPERGPQSVPSIRSAARFTVTVPSPLGTST